MTQIQVGILIISDRSFSGERTDGTTPLLSQELGTKGWIIKKSGVISDDLNQITQTLENWVDNFEFDLILTSGGTGFSPRDNTPEATKKVIDREAPGFSEVMRASSIKVTPHGMLSRAVAGIRKSTLIINLPGSPTGALENFRAISSVLPHAIEQLKNQPSSEAGHRKY
jgi:molybdopterin adenylyltransferase